MSRSFSNIESVIDGRCYTWLVTGVAGFIGSNLLEQLLKLNQYVVGVDNFATGHEKNLAEVRSVVSEEQWGRFSFVEGDIRDVDLINNIFENEIDYVLHQAALGSVPRSIESPLVSNDVNISGFLVVLDAAKNKGVKGFVYAASSSTYGDHPALPKIESNIGNPLSPYAVTKLVNEIYADVYYRVYGFKSLGLRYFNVFGPRQDPNGAYAAVIPKWTAAMIGNRNVEINGDGETSRDFCFIDNVVNANILGAIKGVEKNEVVNVALGDRTTLNELFAALKKALHENSVIYTKDPVYKEFRPGDVRHSQADISKIGRLLGYTPEWRVEDGIRLSMPWYLKNSEG